MTRIFGFLFLVSPFFSMAQTETAETDSLIPTKILIIPFEEKLFYCDIMRDLTEVNQMSKEQIYNRLRSEIQLSLNTALKDSMKTATFLATDSLSETDLVNIYSVLGYKYVPVPISEPEIDSNKKRSTKVKPTPTLKEVGIKEGQVIAERDVVDRYMNAYLKDHAVLSSLDSAYGLNRFLFINQMDVKMDLSDPEKAFLDPIRTVALHYTIMDKDGKQISGGLASENFPGTESRLNYIGSTLYKLSARVVASLFEAEKKEEEKPKAKSKSKSEGSK